MIVSVPLWLFAARMAARREVQLLLASQLALRGSRRPVTTYVVAQAGPLPRHATLATERTTPTARLDTRSTDLPSSNVVTGAGSALRGCKKSLDWGANVKGERSFPASRGSLDRTIGRVSCKPATFARRLRMGRPTQVP